MSPSEFMRAYEAATASHDLERTLELIADDAVYWFSDGSTHHGKEAIAAALRKNFEAIKMEAYRIENLTWLAESEGVAAGIYGFAWSGQIGGVQRNGSGRGSTVLKRVVGGWRVAHEHLSAGRFAL